MTILNSLLKRFSGGHAEVDVATDRSDDGQLPIPGYDQIKEKDLIAELSEHSQVELAAIDTYEHSHKERHPVFNKLRYLRGQEPIQDYDALGVKEILTGLEAADMETLQRTRVYERKFQRRPDLLKEVAAAIIDKRSAAAAPGG